MPTGMNAKMLPKLSAGKRTPTSVPLGLHMGAALSRSMMATRSTTLAASVLDAPTDTLKSTQEVKEQFVWTKQW